MFWRKASNKPDLFTYETGSKRQSVRVHPSSDRPVSIRFEDGEENAITIGAGGLSFQNHGYRKGDVISVAISLPDYPEALTVDMMIVDVCRYDRCHCRFRNLDDAQGELMHKYCLDRQKEAISISKRKGLRK